MLELTNVSIHYGKVPVVHSVSLEVRKGEVVGVMGPNSAGKSTLLKCISGLLKPSSGNIIFEGNDIGHMATFQRSRMGIVLVPEGKQIFPQMTVLDHLLIPSAHALAKVNRNRNFETVFDLFPRLKERLHQKAGTLSGGEQQMMVIARGLMSSPRLLILDEPSLGLAPIMTKVIFDAIQKLHRIGLTTIMVEQNVKYSLPLCNRAYILERGSIVLQGDVDELLRSDKLKKSWIRL